MNKDLIAGLIILDGQVGADHDVIYVWVEKEVAADIAMILRRLGWHTEDGEVKTWVYYV